MYVKRPETITAFVINICRSQKNKSNLAHRYIQSDTKKRELLKNPTKIEEIQEKKLLTEIEPLQLAF